MKKQIWLGLLVVSVVLALAAIAIQNRGIGERVAFGNVEMFSCTKCDALVYEPEDGRLPDRWFRFHKRYWLITGSVTCNHVWHYKGSGHVDGAITPSERFLQDIGHLFFLAAFIAAMSGLLICVARRLKAVTPPNEKAEHN